MIRILNGIKCLVVIMVMVVMVSVLAKGGYQGATIYSIDGEYIIIELSNGHLYDYPIVDYVKSTDRMPEIGVSVEVRMLSDALRSECYVDVLDDEVLNIR